ncbi:MAG: ECF-type sigma factor [Rubripirellula sp.]
MGEDTIAFWIERLKEGQEDASQKMWEHCFDKLHRVARRKLATLPNRVEDEEDLALSAFHSLCRGAKAGRFRRLDSSQDLWQILLMITSRKAVNRIKHHHAAKRGGGKVRGESAFNNAKDGGGINEAVVDEMFCDDLSLECHEMLEGLNDDTLRRIAILKLEGHTNREIAEQLDRAESTIDLKLKLIRSRWDRQIE